ncbi:hypothetical protein DPMN_178923 [Dreissena polymorpha]|uniref:OTU domain-containing protein n=1 Tax=Dreissena polymorpha TaxID=45954 RepID=A0A9D4EF54_DREPO|nr:hypothetical protein DPMN_178923 [Dreissena polymorpha]
MKIDLLRTKKRKLKLLRTRKISADDQCLLLIEKDGNCFFGCIAAGIFDDPEKHELVRTSVTNHMLDNESTYKNYIDGDYGVHITCMKQSDGNSRCWATEAEILVASTLYDVDIYVKQYSNGCFSWLRFSVERETPNRKFICMRLENQHFDFIRQHERPTSVITKETTLSSEEMQTTRCMAKTKTKHDENKMSVVTNLSKKTLTDAQISLLSKGLKFIQTRKTIDKGKLLTDLSAWERRMRLKENFYVEDAEHRTREDEHQYKKKTSTWTPGLAATNGWTHIYKRSKTTSFAD